MKGCSMHNRSQRERNITLAEFQSAVIELLDTDSDEIDFLKDFLLNSRPKTLRIKGRRCINREGINTLVRVLKIAYQNSFYQKWSPEATEDLENIINFLVRS